MIPRARMIFVSPSRACTNLNHKQNPAVPSQKICKPCHWQPLVPMSENQKNVSMLPPTALGSDPVSTRMHCRNEPRAYLRLVAMTSRLLLQRTTGHYTMFQLVAVRTDMETTFAPWSTVLIRGFIGTSCLEIVAPA